LSIYKLRNLFAASADSGVSLDVQFDGTMTGYWWSIYADLDADGENYQVECSFLSSNTLAVNDARGSISTVQQFAAGTPGFIDSTVNAGLSMLNIPVTAGERVHLHAILFGTTNVLAAIYLYVDDRINPRIRRRR